MLHMCSPVLSIIRSQERGNSSKHPEQVPTLAVLGEVGQPYTRSGLWGLPKLQPSGRGAGLVWGRWVGLAGPGCLRRISAYCCCCLPSWRHLSAARQTRSW